MSSDLWEAVVLRFPISLSSHDFDSIWRKKSHEVNLKIKIHVYGMLFVHLVKKWVGELKGRLDYQNGEKGNQELEIRRQNVGKRGKI